MREMKYARKMKKLFVFVLFVCLHCSADEYKYLNDLALKTGADKSSNWHNYTEIYAQYFAPLKEKSIKFLEIGIYQGKSVALWEEYFKNAELHFIDVTFDNIQYYSQRAHYHLANQENPHDLAHFIHKVGGNFDIILDDGGHTMTQQTMSFICLFPHVKSKGMYIIEDLHTSYWPHFGGGQGEPGTTVEFLKSLIDQVNYVGAHTTRATHRDQNPEWLNSLDIYKRDIESIHFYDSVAIIIKR